MLNWRVIIIIMIIIVIIMASYIALIFVTQ